MIGAFFFSFAGPLPETSLRGKGSKDPSFLGLDRSCHMLLASFEMLKTMYLCIMSTLMDENNPWSMLE